MSYCLNPDCQRATSNPPTAKFCQSCRSKLLLKNRYRAIKLIGQGGFGRTFLAVDEDKPSKLPCVIKQFFPQAQGTNNAQKAAELFEQEAVRLDELGLHDQIPKLRAYFTQDQRQYLVQEFIDGQNLAQVLAADGAFKEMQIRGLLNSLLPVLQFIHTHKIIHRDIKPENIIRRPDGQLVLVDFGAAKFATGTALARTGTVIGSAGYAAPEQAMGKAVFASDLYSLGVTCIHLLTQLHPFDLYSVSEAAWVWRDYLSSPVSSQLGQVLDKMLEMATSRRYQSASEVLKALNPQLNQGTMTPVGTPAKLVAQSAPAVITSASKPQMQNWRCVHTLTGHSGGVNSIAISPDGQMLASGSDDHTIKLWRLDTGKEIRTLKGHCDWFAGVKSVAISPDGQMLASGSDDHTIKIWRLDTGKEIHTLTGHLDAVKSIAISPQRRILASGSDDKTIKIWRLDTGREIRTLTGHCDWFAGVKSVAISPDGQMLASGSDDHTIKLWQLTTGKEIYTLQGHSGAVNSIAISPDGQMLASGSDDHTIKLWQLTTGKEIRTLKGHCDWFAGVKSVAISPDGRILASGSDDHTIKLWQLGTGKEIYTLQGHSGAVNSVAISPGGQTIVSGSQDGSIKLWRCDRG